MHPTTSETTKRRLIAAGNGEISNLKLEVSELLLVLPKENPKDRRKIEANLSKILTEQSFDFGDLLVQLFDFLRRQERIVGH